MKVALLMVGLATVPLMIVGTQILSLNKDSLQYEVLRYHTRLAQSLAEKWDGHLAVLEEKIRFIMSTFQSSEISWPERQSILQSLVDSSPSFAVVSIVGQDGKEYMKVYNPILEPELAAFPSLASHSEEPLFQDFLKSKHRVMEVIRDSDNPRLHLYYPLETPTGRHAIYIDTSLRAFWDEILNTRIGQTGFAYLVGVEGSLLAHPDRNMMEEPHSVRTIPLVAAALAGNSGASEFSDAKNVQWIGASAPIRRMQGAIITQQQRNEAYAASRKGQRHALFWIVLSAFLASLIAALFARQITRPVLDLTRAAQDVKVDVGQFPDEVEVRTHDELQDLSETFNTMTKELKSYAAMQLEHLLAEKTKTEAIVFSIVDGLIMTDHQGLIEFINHRARQILGITAEYQSLLKKPLWDFIPHTEALDVLWDITQNPQDNTAREIDLSETGYRRVFKVFSEVVRTPTRGEDIGVVIILHDVTLEKEIEQMKEDFLHSITHDLRNPMTSIRGFLKFLLDELGGPLTEQQRKMLDTMDRASLRLLGMINDILDVAKLEAGKMEVNLAETDLIELSQRILELLQAQAGKKNIELVLDANPQMPKSILDPLLMERLLTNLVGNSIKFTPEKGRITIEWRDTPTQIQGAVCDTGEGMPPDFMDKIFGKFQQVRGQRKGGTGLGLTICKYIVESHKGTIGVESTLGKGSRFYFTIPKGLQRAESGEVYVTNSPAISQQTV
ncbi:MAG TPA: ATP-binding protein [Elusimicrobiota bacterium]|nr:ATP-binding protein [Elusimicrobiota bacterium]